MTIFFIHCVPVKKAEPAWYFCPKFSTANIGDVAMKDLIEYIAKALVDNPESVSVSEVEGNQTSVLELKVAKDDLGKVIGKQGRTAIAMRTILSAASAKIKRRTVLEIIE
jgi:predicted RNA-binding protein YlqC (UPF0109 family)